MTLTDQHPLREADFTLGDDQQTIREVFAAFFARESPPERVRDAEPGGFDVDLWRQLCEMRVVAMGVPEGHGGDGAGYLDMVVVAEQWGRYLAPVPLAETMVAARLLAAVADSSDAARSHLDAVIAGTSLTTLVLQPARPGVAQLVPAAAVADAVIAMIGDTLVLATFDQQPAAMANQGHTPVAWCDPAGDGVNRTVIATGELATQAFAEAVREWKLLMAGALVGITDGALALALTHAKERFAFGSPIGSFQAVAHPLVDVAMDAEMARRIAWKAAWWADVDPSVERHLVPMAFRCAEQAAVHGTTVGVHTLGGVGFTVESDVQLYFRRAKGWALVAGDPERELDSIADELFGPIGSHRSQGVTS